MGDTRATVTLAANLDPSGVLSAVKAMQGAFNNLKLPNNIGEGLDKSLSKATDLLKKYQSQLAKGVDTKTDAKNITKTGAQINEVLDDINHYINELNGQQIFLKADVSGLNKLQTDIEKARTAWKNAIQEFRKNSDIDKVLGGIGEKTTRSNLTQGSINKAKTLFDKGDLEGYRNALDEIYNRVSKLKDTTISNVVKGLGLDDAGSKADNLALIKTQLEAISKLDFSTDENVKAQFDEITNSVSAYENEVKRAGDAGQQAFNDINANKAVNDTRALVTATDQYTDSLMSAKGQVQDLQRSTQYFFSLRNMINLLKRGIDDAIQSVKELDAAMTETAVVTDYKVSDLWGMLPQYTQLANQLGATTQGAYETMTLYFQQGLDQQAAFEIGAETMKMARIAGLEYAETTDMMTAALRGFNMELNETSAKRINDVYSELAAITASDTEELGTAMQRTASIAHSAGMSFEGTTAFLAQAIETTREPAENIGTAMKTIVARFQEMKENPLEISEVDGEEVNYNKVDAALKSIGVSLKDTNGQFRELDQVFLDISSRWDSLSQTQQRYIATVAAGSRQQSRFIAMMDNYDRTVQLFEAANNSAGASDEQFGKTMDSLESKLNKLHNAWQAFTMGIANNGMIKLAVDGLTGFLTVTNKIIDTLSLGSGAIKSFLSVFAAFTGLKMAGRAANSLIGGLGGLVDPQSTVKEGLKIGLFGQGKTNAQAQAISNPIVQAIHQLQTAITKQPISAINQPNGTGNYQTFKTANADLRSFLKQAGVNGSISLDTAYSKISKLDDKQQASILQQLPGLQFDLQKNGIRFKKQDISSASQKLLNTFNQEINNGLKKKTIDTQTAMKIFGTPENLRTALAAKGEEYAQVADEILYGGYDEAAKAAELEKNYLDSGNDYTPEEAKKMAKIAAETTEKQAYAEKRFKDFAQVTQSSGAMLANSIGNIGTVAINAGQGIAQLGMQLSNAGFEQAGAAVTNLGYQISSLGQIASSVGSVVGKISGAGGIGAIAAAHPVITGLTAAVLALGGAFALIHHNIQKTKEAGKEITENFIKTSKETADNISKLKSYQDELAALSEGVDVNGNNVKLDDSQYQRYLEIVDDIAAINPDIVRGYNAQGHAIIDNNTALKDTLNLQQQIQKEAYRTYLSTDSLQTLINARNVNTDYRKATKNFTSSKAEDSGKLNPNNAPLASDVRKLAKDLQFSTGFDESILRKYGIESLDALIEGQEEAVNKFVRNQDKIQQELTNSGLQMGEDVLKGFETLGEDTQAFDEAIKPVYDNLLTSISNSSAYKELAPEMQSAITEGLKGIAGQNLDANEMESAAKALMLNFDSAFSKAEDPLNRADKALEQFTQDLDEAAYNRTAENIATELRNLAKEAEAVGQVEIAEWYENQASRIESAITNATYSIAEGIDTLSDNITKAKSSFESLAEGIDDYYTLSDQAKGLVDAALEDKNTGGNGSKTFWRTYQGLASEEAFNKHDKDEALADMQQFQKYFAEGAEGATAFAQKLINAQNTSFKFTENNGKETTKHVSDFFKLAKDGTMQITDEFRNLSDEQYAQLAAAFRLSDDGFTAILNNLRQWGDLDFSDSGLIRKALAVDDRSVTTNKKISVEGQEDKVSRLYYGQSVLDTEMADKSEAERENVVRDLEVQGSIRLPSGAEELIKAPSTLDGKDAGGLLKQFVNDTKGTGNQVQNVMAALIKSGEYNKEDLGKIHQSILDQNLLAGASDIGKSFEDIYSGAELEVTDPATEAANEHLSAISSTVSTIAGIIGADKITEGYLPETAKQSNNLYNDLVGQLGKADTWAQLFSQGKDIENGGVITADKFTEYTNQLIEYGKKNDEYIAALKEGRENAKTPEETAAFDAEIEKAQHNADLIAMFLQNAATSFANIQSEFNSLATSTRDNLAAIANNPDLTPEAQKTQTANTLIDFANKLDGLNFNPEQIQSVFKDNFGIELELEGGKFATDIGTQINEQINGQNFDINAVLNIASISMPGAARGKNNTPSAIRRVGTMARGSKKRGYTINGEPTLTGELGPELVWEPRQNTAYMVGEHGPQFANLSKNAVVWNAQQTKKIKKNSKGINALGTGARGIHSFGTMAGGNAAAGGGTTLPGVFNLDANAMVQEVTPPAETPSIPVKAKLEVEGNNQGGILGKLFGGKNNGPSIDVAANVTTINTNEQSKTISVIGNITQLKTSGANQSVEATALVTRVIKSGQVAGEPVSVKATATTTKVENKKPVQKESAGTQIMKVTADTSAAQAKINQLIRLFNKTYTLKYQASGPRSISVPISANFTGSWKKTVEISKSGANGINNQGFGSLANGSKYGTVGPKNKGGLTLTGEKGFEIAWLPSENKSMILGANGPQMLELPKDAVVFTNEQSKKILKQKAIPAGSHADTTAKGTNIFKYLNVGSSSATITRNNNTTISKSLSDAGKKVQQDSKEAKEKIARVSVWWENIARRTEATQRKMDNNAKSFEKYLKNANATLKGAGTTGKGNAYIANIRDYVDLNTKQVRRANRELKKLYKGKGTSNSESEKNQKRLKKRYKKGDVNVTEVSYDKKGKTKKAFVDLNKYITKDSATGALQVNEDKLKKISNVNKRKAVAEAANKEIDDRTAKKTKAEDAIQKAQDALDKMGQDLYETFFKWETELTKIWNITQKIEAAEARAAEAKEGSSLLEAQLASGRAQATQEFAEQSKKIYQLELDNEVKALQQKAASVQDKQEALNRAINIDDEIAQLNAVTDKLNGSTAAKAKADKADQTLNSKQAKLNKKQQELAAVRKGRTVAQVVRDKNGKVKKHKNGDPILTYRKIYDTELIKKLQNEVNQLTTQVNTAKQRSKTAHETAKASTLSDTQRLAYETYAQELQNDIKTLQQASGYTTINRMGDGTVEIEFDSKALMDAQDAGTITSDEAKRIEDYVKNIQDTNKDLQDTYKDVTTGMTDMYNRLDTLKDNWADYADQLWDISDKEQQERVNELKDLSTSINNALKNLLDNVKKKLDERRQQEDNAKTEADISRKQQRLTMLQADTSGGHQVEIAQLQQEIATAQQDYQRSLEDQLLERLQNQADVAAEQRERMIELEEGAINAINNAALVDTWMAAAKQASLTGNPKELEQYREQMYNAYMTANDADQKPEAIRQQLETSFNTLYNGLLTNQAEQKAVSDKLDVLEGTKEDVASASSTLGQILSQLESMNIVDSVQKDPNAGKGAEVKAAVDDSKKAVASSQKSNTKTNAQVYKEKLDQYSKNGKLSNKELDNIIKYGKAAGKSEAEIVKALAGTKVTWKDIITEAKQNKYTESRVKGWFSSGWSKKHKESFAKAFNDIYKPKKKMKEKYATGGLNTYTGPAWLDGTPSKPELVLNAQDTKNFIALKDVLSKAIGSTSHIENSYGGDANFEININVDHISSDYDVNKVVDQVEKRIVQKSGYRNVTQVRNFR